MSGKRYTEDLRIEAVKQVTDRGYKIGEVAKRLGATPKSMHDCIKQYPVAAMCRVPETHPSRFYAWLKLP